MIDKKIATMNLSAYRQLQSEIQTLIYKLEIQIEKDPVIYGSCGPDSALDYLYLADNALEETIETLAEEEYYAEVP